MNRAFTRYIVRLAGDIYCGGRGGCGGGVSSGCRGCRGGISGNILSLEARFAVVIKGVCASWVAARTGVPLFSMKFRSMFRYIGETLIYKPVKFHCGN